MEWIYTLTEISENSSSGKLIGVFKSIEQAHMFMLLHGLKRFSGKTIICLKEKISDIDLKYEFKGYVNTGNEFDGPFLGKDLTVSYCISKDYLNPSIEDGMWPRI